MIIKRICAGVFLCLGILGILNTVFVFLLSGGMNFGTVLPGIIGGVLIIFSVRLVFYRKPEFEKQWSPQVLWVRRCFFFCALLGLLSFLVIEGEIIFHSRPDPVEEVDYLIILGAGLNGETLSWTLVERMQKGLAYLEEYPKAKVVLSGGQGPGESITEAEGMRRFLIQHQIAEERIIKEERSTSTMENLRFSKDILARQPEFRDDLPVAVITNDFHLFRTKFLARRNGFIPMGIPSPTPWYIVPNVYLREYFAVVKSGIFDR